MLTIRILDNISTTFIFLCRVSDFECPTAYYLRRIWLTLDFCRLSFLNLALHKYITFRRHVPGLKSPPKSPHMAFAKLILHHCLQFLCWRNTPCYSLGISAHMDVETFSVDLAWALVSNC